MKLFSHIYIEKEIVRHPRTLRILALFPDAEIIMIDRYMDIFGRRHQDINLQRQSPALILARAVSPMVYKGAPVCQDFGSDCFYYASCMKNCLFDCEYCYLKGMYSCGHIVIFVNIEDIMAEAEKVLSGARESYLSVSFDTDLMAFDSITGYAEEWINFAGEHPDITLEIRTKGAVNLDNNQGDVRNSANENSGKFTRRNVNESLYTNINKNMVFAFTLSPQLIIDRFEHYTASLQSRINSVKNVISAGGTVRLCFDPMIYVPEWQDAYGSMIEAIKKEPGINPDSVRDISIGTFRISKEYLKAIRRAEPYSAAVQYPFVTIDGYCQYEVQRQQEMTDFLTDGLLNAGFRRSQIYSASSML